MNKIIKLSILNIIRNKNRNKIYILIITLFMLVISIVFNLSFLLNHTIKESTNQITIEILNNDLMQIVENLGDELNSYEFIDNIDFIKTDSSELIYINIVLDKNSSIEKIIYTLESYFDQKIGDENYIFNNNDQLDSNKKIVKNIIIVVNVIFFFILYLTFISINIILKKSLDERVQEIALYKSIGYRNINLFKLIFYELLTLIMFSYILSTIISILILGFLLFFYLHTVNLNLNLILVYIFLLMLWILIALVMSCISMFKIRKIPPITLLFSE